MKRNLSENLTFFEKKQKIILKEKFLFQSDEVLFRSFVELIQIIGKKYHPVRGKIHSYLAPSSISILSRGNKR